MELLKECPLLKIEDILPFFPDFVTIDHFKVFFNFLHLMIAPPHVFLLKLSTLLIIEQLLMMIHLSL